MSIRNRVGTDVGKVKKSDIYMWILLGVFAGYVAALHKGGAFNHG